jgi:uncharacterized membrane protein
VSTQPNQGNNPDQNSYGGYGGYQPPKPADDPYGAYYQPTGTTGTAGTAGADGTSNPQSDPTYVYGQQPQQGQQYASSGQQQQQQYNTYQPPSSVSGKSYSASGQTSTGLEPRVAALLSYLGICFTGLIFLIVERKNRLVRFSAAQSVVVFFPLLIVYGILHFIIGLIASIWIIGGLIAFFLNAAVLVLIIVPGVLIWLFLMLQAYRGVEVKLPIVGQYAETLLRVFSPRQKKAGY